MANVFALCLVSLTVTVVALGLAYPFQPGYPAGVNILSEDRRLLNQFINQGQLSPSFPAPYSFPVFLLVPTTCFMGCNFVDQAPDLSVRNPEPESNPQYQDDEILQTRSLSQWKFKDNVPDAKSE